MILNSLSIDVEDWFHILDSDVVPLPSEWDLQEDRIERNMYHLLDLLEEKNVKATFFWLGWVAKRHYKLVCDCASGGHEIASHGFNHILAYRVNKHQFHEDITKAKILLEDISGSPVVGFRAPGFSITDATPWAFDIIKRAGYEYDSSVFPSSRAHGGMRQSSLEPHVITTNFGPLVELGIPMIDFLGRRFNFFGGGYLRLSPQWLIRWGIDKLQTLGRPLIIYLHPREIDPEHPRLPLPLFRRFKCYVNLHTTLPKLKWLCNSYSFHTMSDLAAEIKARSHEY